MYSEILIHHYILRRCQLLLVTSLCFYPFAFAMGKEDGLPAEYAIRWDPSQSGPESAKDVAKLLKFKKPDPDEYKVRYFGVTKPPATPSNYKVILRERVTKKKNQLTLKYRGNEPLQVNDYSKWECPLGTTAEKKYEIDISALSKEQENIKKSYSLSCSIESKFPIEIPKKLEAKQVGCEIEMTRFKSDDDIKIEEWKFKNKRLIEVSMPGLQSDVDRDMFFRNIVYKLLDLKVIPIDRSKSETGEDC